MLKNKIRLQSNKSTYKSAFQSLRYIIKNEKFIGLYKGIIPPLINNVPNSAM